MNRVEAYRLLEIPNGSSVEEAKKAYRRLAMKWHPDRNKEPAAEAKFKEIKEAFELIESGKDGPSSESKTYKNNPWANTANTGSSPNFEDIAEMLKAYAGN